MKYLQFQPFFELLMVPQLGSHWFGDPEEHSISAPPPIMLHMRGAHHVAFQLSDCTPDHATHHALHCAPHHTPFGDYHLA